MWVFSLQVEFRGLFSMTFGTILISATQKDHYLISATIMVKTALTTNKLKGTDLTKWCY